MKVFSNPLKDNKIIFKKNERPISAPESPVFRRLLYILIGVTFGRSVMAKIARMGERVFKARFRPSERPGFPVNMNYILPPIRR